MLSARRSHGRLFELLTVLVMLVTACGGGDGEGSATTADGGATTTAAGGGDTTAPGAGDTTTTEGGNDCVARIYMITSLTGAASSNGESTAPAAQALVDEVNANGGVVGCQIELTIADNESDANNDLPMTQEAMAEQEYELIYNAGFGGPTTVPFLVRENQLTILGNGTPGVATPETPYVFDVVPSTGHYSDAAAVAALDAGSERAGIVVNDTTLGTQAAEAFQVPFEAGGGQVVLTEQIADESVDMGPAVTRLQANDVDVIFLNLFGAGAGTFFTAMETAGFDVRVYGGSSTGATDIASLVGESAYANAQLMVPDVSAYPASESSQALIDRLLAAGTEIQYPLKLYAHANDAIATFVWAVEGAGSFDAEEVSAFLEANGDVEVSNLTVAPTIGYSAEIHQMQQALDTIVAVQAAPLEDGQFPRS